MALSSFHPLVSRWFSDTLGQPTRAQALGWAAIREHRHTLIAAPTGSGKTLAAFLTAIDDLVRQAADAPLPDQVRVVYVSPLKALSADIHKNLAEPRTAIERLAEDAGLPLPRITSAVRTGDTPASERAAMLKSPPHILVTTPESLYLLLTAARSREMLRTVRTVIVDEIHAVIGTRRGAHLALTLERLQAVAAAPPLRIGLSATQKPIEAVAQFLTGGAPCAIVDEGHRRTMDLGLEIPKSALDAVMSHEIWEEYFDRLTALIEQHRTTLVFVNTRRMAERVARHLSERLGDEAVTAHHGSLSKEKRLDAETRLKAGRLRALVATASLELGIDIGSVDLVCQIGSPNRISTLLQRVGRSGHTISGTPKGRLFPVSRDDLVECAALMRAARRGELDAIVTHDEPLDVLAQQIVAETACQDYAEDELFALCTRAWPYRALSRSRFDAVVAMTANGFVTRRGRRSALVHRDEVNARLHGRRGARMLAIASGGAIPEVADYRVVLDPGDTFIGTLNEDFAIESHAGDVIQLGNASWQVLQVGTGVVRVADAKGAPPTLPFWLGEAPARSDELSRGVSDLRADIEAKLTAGLKPCATAEDEVAQGFSPAGLVAQRFSPAGLVAQRFSPAGPVAQRFSPAGPVAQGFSPAGLVAQGFSPAGLVAQGFSPAGPVAQGFSPAGLVAQRFSPAGLVAQRFSPAGLVAQGFSPAITWLAEETGIPAAAAEQIVSYLAESRRALGALPTQDTIVLERFFDESGGMQLVLHAPFGSRVNKAWSLALRKRFCRQFNFELQAAATEDALLLSLGPQHSFPLADVFRYLHPATTRDVLVQAFLDAPVFQTRWRWNTTISLAVPRNRGGKKVPPQLQRMLADDLMAAVFPDAAACLENIPGDRQIPDHPLVSQAVRDCLEEAMDFDALSAVLGRIHGGTIRCIAVDTPEPSALSHEILNARPHAFMDDAPLEERRTQAVYARRAGEPSSAGDLGALDAAAIERVRDEARPDPRDADELHDALLSAGFLTQRDVRSLAPELFPALVKARRACEFTIPNSEFRILAAAERLPELRAIHPEALSAPPTDPPASRAAHIWTRDAAIVELFRGRVAITGPTTAEALARDLAIPVADADAALLALESEGLVLRGSFTHAGLKPCATDDPEIAARKDVAQGFSPAIEWCDRRLLARIHRYTLNRLRAEIEPVSQADFMRFLFAWQHVAPWHRLSGIDGLRAALESLDGFELAADAWERSILPDRVEGYQASMLDTLCLTGEAGWARLSSPATDATQVVGATPIALFLREHAEAWAALKSDADDPTGEVRGATVRGAKVLDLLRRRGACFIADLMAASGLDEAAVRAALADLVSAGLVASDGFGGLRAIIRSSSSRSANLTRNNGTGRWSLLPDRRAEALRHGEAPLESGAGLQPCDRDSAVELQARTLLKRYGVVFRKLLAREANLAPWRELTRVFRRLEARGEIRGGRFVSGMSGEQFALASAVERLREIRRTATDGRCLVISAADPLNLAGIITPGDRVRAAAATRIAYRDGTPIAAMEGDYVRPLIPLTDVAPALAAEVATTLAGRPMPAVLSGFIGRS